MYNRKFNTKKDFSELITLEYEILPIVDKIKDDEEKQKLREYIVKTFYNQWKK